MVRLHTFLLAVTMAMGPALAFSSDYQRRSELDIDTQVESRGFEYDEELVSRGLEDYDDLFERDTYLEPREPSFPLSGLAKTASKFHSPKNMKRLSRVGSAANGAANGMQTASDLKSSFKSFFGRDLDLEELLEREYDLLDERDTFDDLD